MAKVRLIHVEQMSLLISEKENDTGEDWITYS